LYIKTPFDIHATQNNIWLVFGPIRFHEIYFLWTYQQLPWELLFTNLTVIILSIELLTSHCLLFCDFLRYSLLDAFSMNELLEALAVAGMDQRVVFTVLWLVFRAKTETYSTLILFIFFEILIVIRVIAYRYFAVFYFFDQSVWHSHFFYLKLTASKSYDITNLQLDSISLSDITSGHWPHN